ncbi:hypothetical protein ACMD2_20863 [Ananas comosus]
MFVRN